MLNERVFSLLFIVLGVGIAAQSRELGARYLLPLLALTLCLPFALASRRPMLYREEMIAAGIALALCAVSIVGCATLADAAFSVVKVSLAFLYFFVTLLIGRHLSQKMNVRLMHVISSMALALLTIEFLRIYIELGGFQGVARALAENFYLAKTIGHMFVDTNALALYALMFIAILMALREKAHARTQIPLIAVLSFFVALSLSRAAMAALLVMVWFYGWRNGSRVARVALVVGAIAVLGFGIDFLIEANFFEGSGQRKLDTYRRLGDLMRGQTWLVQMFGVGVSEGNYLYSDEDGGYSHTLVTMLLGQVGITGLVLYFLFWTALVAQYGTRMLYVVIPVFVAGLSYIHPFYETILWAAGITALLSPGRLAVEGGAVDQSARSNSTMAAGAAMNVAPNRPT